jgi:serpin B
MSFEDEVNFCLNFLKAQDVSEKSCVYSPISLLNSLAMVYAGCDGNTAKEIENVIGKGKIKDEIINYYSNYIKRHKAVKEDGDDKIVATLLSEGSGAMSSSYSLSDTIEANTKLIKDDEPVKFKVNATNKLFVDIAIKVLDSFIEIINQKFDGEIHLVNFKEKNSEAVNQISKFVNDTTNQLIYRESQDVNVETKLILLNETYFIGRWATPFISREKGTFYSKIPREIDFMQKDKVCNYIEGDDWKCVGIPYKGWNIWMFVILPNENDGLQGLINKMDYSLLMECTIGYCFFIKK